MHSHTHTGMRGRPCNLRRGHLEIWDGGINSIEKKERVLQKGLEGRVRKACVKMKCYSAVFNDPSASVCLFKKKKKNMEQRGVTFRSPAH